MNSFTRFGRMGSRARVAGGGGNPLSITAPRGYPRRNDQFPLSIANTISFADSEDDGSGIYTVTITMLGGKAITRAGWTGSPGTVISRNGTLAVINGELAAALDLPAYTSEFFDGNTVRLVRDADGMEIERAFGVAAFGPLSSAAINNDVADGTLLDTVLPDVPGMVPRIVNYSATLDTTAPSLTVPVSTETGSTTGTIGATTDTGEGVMDAVLTQSATPPSAPQVIAGTDENDLPADVSGTQAISTTGAKTFDAAGLNAETTYYGYIVQTDARGNVSDVFACGSFTTSAAVTFLPDDLFDGTSAGSVGTEKGVWLDETDLDELFQLINSTTPVTTAGQLIGANTDKSGNANTAVAPANDTTRPTYVSGGGAEFTRSPITRLTVALGAAITGTVLHVFAVVKAPAGENNNARYVSLSDTAFSDDFFNFQYGIPIQYTSAAQFSAFRGLVALSAAAAADDQFHLVESLWDGTNHTLTVDTVDGTPVADNRSFDFDLIGIGAPPAGKGDDSCQGVIKEVILLDRNTALTTDRASIRTYLNNKHVIY